MPHPPYVPFLSISPVCREFHVCVFFSCPIVKLMLSQSSSHYVSWFILSSLMFPCSVYLVLLPLCRHVHLCQLCSPGVPLSSLPFCVFRSSVSFCSVLGHLFISSHGYRFYVTSGLRFFMLLLWFPHVFVFACSCSDLCSCSCLVLTVPILGYHLFFASVCLCLSFCFFPLPLAYFIQLYVSKSDIL